MKRSVQKWLPVSMAALMMLPPVMPALAAEDSTEKEEVVYATLDANGDMDSLYVVNAFNLDAPQTITDYGTYTQTKNLSTSDSLVYQDGKVTISAPKGRFYYQGHLENRQLPWTVKVSYSLDGKQIDPKELAGKSGHLEIKLDILKNNAVDASFFDSYALQATMALSTENCKNIEAEGATVANVGTDKQLTYTILPGSEKHIVVKSDVTDFEMDGININGISLALDIDADSIDTSSFAGKISEMKNAVSQIDGGAQKLEASTKKLENGLSDLTSNSSELLNYSNTIYGYLGDLQDGTGTLVEKVSALPASLNSAIDNLDKITAQSEQEQQILAALSASTDPQVQALLKIYNTKMAGVSQIKQGLSAKQTELGKMAPSVNALTTSVSALHTQYGKFNGALSQYIGGVGSAQQGASLLANGAQTLANGTGEMNQQTSHLDETIDEELQKAIDSFAGKDFKPVSFVSPENEHVDAVQFVLKTEDIHKPETPVPAEEETPHLSFWQKLSNLF